MARKRPPPSHEEESNPSYPEPKKMGNQIRLSPMFLRRLRGVCGFLGVEPADFIEKHLAPILDAQTPAALEEHGLAPRSNCTKHPSEE